MMYKNSSINTRKKLLALAIGCTLSGGNLYAQEEAPTVSEDPGENIEEIVVRGVRASQAKAIDIKRNSRTVVDSIVAEDIGKLPDVTITDSLQRVTGDHAGRNIRIICLDFSNGPGAQKLFAIQGRQHLRHTANI